MEKYDSYKFSGIDWIGEIPSHWEAVKLKYLTESRKELSEDGGEELLSVTESRGIVKRQELKGNDENLSRSENLTGYRLVKQGNLVNNIMLMWKRGLGVSPYNGVVSPAYSVFSFINNCHPAYFHYLLRSKEYITEFRRNSTGVVMSRLRLYDDSFGSIFSHYPPTNEQKLISRYLDKKNKQINSLTEKIQKKVELLKEQRTSLINHYVTKGLDPNVEMRDSGVEWIGEIPSHWRRQRIKYFLSYTKGFAFKSEVFKDEGIPIVKASDIKRETVKNPTVFLEPADIETYSRVILRTGDIVVSTVGSQYSVTDSAVGQLAMVPKELDGSLLNQNTVTVRLNDGHINRKYLFYTFLTRGFRSHLDVHSHGTANQASLNVEDILNYEMFFPDTSEQEKIVSSLEIELKILDQSQNLELKRIRLLQEYRQSLISSVVTGKVRVTEDMI